MSLKRRHKSQEKSPQASRGHSGEPVAVYFTFKYFYILLSIQRKQETDGNSMTQHKIFSTLFLDCQDQFHCANFSAARDGVRTCVDCNETSVLTESFVSDDCLMYELISNKYEQMMSLLNLACSSNRFSVARMNSQSIRGLTPYWNSNGALIKHKTTYHLFICCHILLLSHHCHWMSHASTLILCFCVLSLLLSLLKLKPFLCHSSMDTEGFRRVLCWCHLHVGA